MHIDLGQRHAGQRHLTAPRIPVAQQQLEHGGLAPAGRPLDTQHAMLRHVKREVGQDFALPRICKGDVIKTHAHILLRHNSAILGHSGHLVHQSEQSASGRKGLSQVSGQGGERQSRSERAGEQHEGGNQSRNALRVRAGTGNSHGDRSRCEHSHQESADSGETAVDLAEFGVILPQRMGTVLDGLRTFLAAAKSDDFVQAAHVIEHHIVEFSGSATDGRAKVTYAGGKESRHKDADNQVGSNQRQRHPWA